jgi:hypothetical protein
VPGKATIFLELAEKLGPPGEAYWPSGRRGEGEAHGFLGVRQGQGVVVPEGVWKAYPMKSFDMM